MWQAFLNIFRIKELRNKLLFTLSMLAIYRIGFFIPLPGVDQEQLADWATSAADGAVGNLIAYVGIFTGGSLGQSTIFGLGIMPYISAAIIFQLLGSVSERLKALQKEGPTGRQKIQEWTRYATVGLCLVQAIFWMQFLVRSNLVYAEYTRGLPAVLFWTCGIFGLTAGTVFLMWLGEQIDKYGIGNGISLIITAGIIASMPGAITSIIMDSQLPYSLYTLMEPVGLWWGDPVERPASPRYNVMDALFLIAAFVSVVAGAILITQGQRRIPIQQAKHTRGRRVYGGQKAYLPLRVNHGGVMPIIFASSLMIFPSLLFGWMVSEQFAPDLTEAGWFMRGYWSVVTFLNDEFANMTGYLYAVVYIILIYFFAYFWTTVQFQPKEMAEQLRDNGSFIPGLRPGPRTADYLETVMERITYVGAGALALIAVIPTIVSGVFDIDFLITQFLGGTGLLIVVSVMLDFLQRIDANLLMRNYRGFLGEDGGRIRRTRGT
jgi:preprotein translocase subunit SecY